MITEVTYHYFAIVIGLAHTQEKWLYRSMNTRRQGHWGSLKAHQPQDLILPSVGSPWAHSILYFYSTCLRCSLSILFAISCSTHSKNPRHGIFQLTVDFCHSRAHGLFMLVSLGQSQCPTHRVGGMHNITTTSFLIMTSLFRAGGDKTFTNLYFHKFTLFTAFCFS